MVGNACVAAPRKVAQLVKDAVAEQSELPAGRIRLAKGWAFDVCDPLRRVRVVRSGQELISEERASLREDAEIHARSVEQILELDRVSHAIRIPTFPGFEVASNAPPGVEHNPHAGRRPNAAVDPRLA